VLGRRLLPECEVCLVALLANTIKSARSVLHVVEVATRENAVVVLLVVLLHVEVDRAVALVCESVVENLLHELLLLDDVTRSVRLDAWRQHVQRFHSRMVAVGVILRNLHRFELLQTSLLLDLVVAFVGVVLQVTHVGDVAHVAHLIAEVLEVAEENVERDSRARMAQVWVAIDGRSADVHAHVRGVQRLEHFLATRQRIVNPKCLFHYIFVLFFVIRCCVSAVC